MSKVVSSDLTQYDVSAHLLRGKMEISLDSKQQKVGSNWFIILENLSSHKTKSFIHRQNRLD